MFSRLAFVLYWFISIIKQIELAATEVTSKFGNEICIFRGYIRATYQVVAADSHTLILSWE